MLRRGKGGGRFDSTPACPPGGGKKNFVARRGKKKEEDRKAGLRDFFGFVVGIPEGERGLLGEKKRKNDFRPPTGGFVIKKKNPF